MMQETCRRRRDRDSRQSGSPLATLKLRAHCPLSVWNSAAVTSRCRSNNSHLVPTSMACSSPARTSDLGCRSASAQARHRRRWCRRVPRRPGSTTSHRRRRRCRSASASRHADIEVRQAEFRCLRAEGIRTPFTVPKPLVDLVVVVADAAVEDDEILIVGGIDARSRSWCRCAILVGLPVSVGVAGERQERELRIEDAHAGQRPSR